MKKLYIIWQDPKSRSWYPVGRLTKSNGLYEFVYTRGALKSQDFVPFGRLSDVRKGYKSDVLFPLFSNRLLPKSRPEYGSYVQWIGLTPDDADPFDILALTGGIRQTDPLTIYSPPTKENGEYRLSFFCHGIRHLDQDSRDAVSRLRLDERLYLMRDVQNPVDPNAVAIRSDSPCRFIGYVPRFLAKDVSQLVSKYLVEAAPRLSVKQVNTDAPLQFRLLCQLVAKWPQGFEPCSDEDFTPIADLLERRAAV